jgi:hypothetical protein
LATRAGLVGYPERAKRVAGSVGDKLAMGGDSPSHGSIRGRGLFFFNIYLFWGTPPARGRVRPAGGGRSVRSGPGGSFLVCGGRFLQRGGSFLAGRGSFLGKKGREENGKV